MTLYEIYLFGIVAWPIIFMARFVTSEKVRQRMLMTKGYNPSRHILAIVLASIFWPVSVPLIVLGKVLGRKK